MQRTAQQWLVYRLTGSALDLGIVSFATFAPFLLLSPVAGLLIDRADRRRLVLATQISYVLLGALQAVLLFTGLIQFWHVVAIAFLLGLTETFEFPARLALIGRVVPPSDLLNAVALHALAFNGARILGPALAGLLLTTLSEGLVFLLNALSYVPVLLGLLFMRLEPDPNPRVNGTAFNDLRDGWWFAISSRRITTLTLIVMVQGVLVLPYMALVPIFAGEVLQAGPPGLGALATATGVGALIGAVSLIALDDRARRGRWLLIGIVGFAAALAVFSLSRSLPLSLAALVVLGWSQVVHHTTSNTLVQVAIPAELQGRVLGLYVWFFGGALPVGSLLLGLAAHQWGAPAALLAAVSIYAVVICLIVLRRPDLMSWD